MKVIKGGGGGEHDLLCTHITLSWLVVARTIQTQIDIYDKVFGKEGKKLDTVLMNYSRQASIICG